MAKIAQRQVVARVAGWDPANRPYFAQVSGGEITAPVEKAYDGGALFPEPLMGPAEVGDITVTRVFDPVIDGPLLKTHRPLVGRYQTDITVYSLDRDLKIGVPGTERVYPQAVLVSITEVEGDSASGTPATFSLTFSIGTVAAQ